VLAGSTPAQLLVILALGASLHAVGARASFAPLVAVNTLATLIGSAVPVPGGAGVVEAGLIAGLTAAGIPGDQAVAAMLIQRFFAAYLPYRHLHRGTGRPVTGQAPTAIKAAVTKFRKRSPRPTVEVQAEAPDDGGFLGE